MPIVDVTLVLARGALPPKGVARELANAIGLALKAEPGLVWVRLHVLGTDQYAENESTVEDDARPVFVSVLHAKVPEREALSAELASLVSAIAACRGRQRENVHVEYAPAGAGRIAFGGKLVQ